MGSLALLACAAALLLERGNPAVELRLQVTTPGPGLEAVLSNRSGAEVTFLRNSELQPSRLVLTDTAGQEMKPFDERTRRKYDRSVSRAMYVKVPPGGSVALEKGVFRKLTGGRYELRWGPFTFRSMPAGEWKARAEFDSAIDYVTEKGRRTTLPGVWKGHAASAELEISLAP